jgi:Domain of unknown function (DUF6438)
MKCMQINRFMFFLAYLLLLSSCIQTKRKEQNQNNSVQKITVAFSGYGCESDCPFQALSVDKELNIYYFGGAYSKKNGYYRGRITQTTWENLKIQFFKFYLKGIDTAEGFKTDHPSVEFYITTSLDKKYFKENTGRMVGEDLEILYSFIKLASQTNSLKPCDSLPFETTLQRTNFSN